MIRLDGLTITHGQVVAVDHLDATFDAGTVFALVGGDGAGKSTLLRTLARPQGRRLPGITCPAQLTQARIGYQSAGSGVWPNMSVRENLEFVAATHGFTRTQAATRTTELLEATDLAGAADRVGAHLSGGMRQKLGVAMAMFHRPDLLLLDELTTGVDPDSRKVVQRLIREAAQDGACVVVSTTYLDEAEGADQVLLLDGGRLLASGTAGQVIALTPGSLWARPASPGQAPDPDPRVWQRGHTQHEWTPAGPSAPKGAASGAPRVLNGAEAAHVDLELSTIAFLLAEKSGDADASGTGGKDENADAAAKGRTRKPATLARRATADGNEPEGAPPGQDRGARQPIVRANGVVKTFGGLTALDGVDLEVRPGQVVGLVGGNGAGKSTLIRLLLGLDRPDRGTVELLGGAPTRRARSTVGYVPQALGMYSALTVLENMQFMHSVFAGRHKADLAALVPEGIDPDTAVGDLPLGARRRLAVACALSHDPQLLVLDEPTSGMDSLSRAHLWKELRRSAARGVGILVTTHYPQEAAQCDVLVRLEAGQVVST
ncbi:ATP-binding cassette domain-containing protein [Schaalia sp. 19OD2882]|uniref:ATP-binding cassette domain-containing protein n=1 Tax=Schaalia sp. 19OD2882 TaxID=2794089 RepID=UPI001C1EF3AD|nr:ATP-binding cassette domain-containing protein [Schaalia sp. 19OD2882]QWW19753.1 ATP-binding cassette domain-containing protein [Schaalia sp. 19OD2882]